MWNEQVTGGTPYYGGCIHIDASALTRYEATIAGAIRDLIRRDASYIQRFRCTV